MYRGFESPPLRQDVEVQQLSRTAADLLDGASDRTHDLLDVTRITRGKIRLEKERLPLSDLVERTIEDHRALFSSSDIALTHRVESDLWIDADKARLTQAVGNLLQNAAKFTPRGGSVSVSLERARADEAVIRVRDTGVGMSPETLEHVFEPFTQAERTLDRTKGGLGLGLSLVKGFVSLHGGSVAARSAGPGQGTEFEVRLPLAAAPDAAPVESPRETPAKSYRVLIIEDNHDTADSLSDALALAHHSVAVSYSGIDGVEKARSFRPDVILCDIGLPELDGYEVARTIRADPELASAALIALTGYAGPDDVSKAEEAGFDLHIAKPPSVESLQRILADLDGLVAGSGREVRR